MSIPSIFIVISIVTLVNTATTSAAPAAPAAQPPQRPRAFFVFGEKLGAPPTLPYLSPQLDGDNQLVGANFASANVGILNDTGFQFWLYDLGVIRRVLVTGTGPLGCVPGELAFRSRDGSCAAEPQLAAELYNPKLVAMIKELNTELKTDTFVAANAMSRQNDFLSNPLAFGFKEARVACCEQRPLMELGFALDSHFCVQTDKTIYHPTEQANRMIVQKNTWTQ